MSRSANDLLRHMRDDVATLVERFFSELEDDVEFCFSSRRAPYSVIGPTSDNCRILYVTKPATIAMAFHDRGTPVDISMMGRYGLPSRADVEWIRRVVGISVLYFLGDMDPVDLLIFAWLRAMLRPRPIAHYGVNDLLLARLQVVVPETFTIELSTSERNALPLVEHVIPDLNEVAGPECKALLLAGRKIEVEAVISALGAPAPLLMPLSK